MELLSAILSEKNEGMSQQNRSKWLSRLLHWFQRPRSSDEKELNWERVYTTRLKFLILQIKSNPEWRLNVEQNLRSVIIDLVKLHQLSLAGLPNETGFFQDLVSRIQNKILPDEVITTDLGLILNDIFNSEDEIVMIDAIDEDTIKEFISEVFIDQSDFIKIRMALIQSLARMSIQLANSSLWLSNKLLKRGFSEWDVVERISNKILFYFSTPDSIDIVDLIGLNQQLESKTLEIQSNIGLMGVEVETVYTLQVQLKRIKRFRLISYLLDDRTPLELSSRLFFSELVRDVYESRGIKSFLINNLELLSKRVAQGNSAVGEHYVVKSWDDVRSMLYSALGGGFITAITVFLKHVLSLLHLSGFLKGITEAINYSFSFMTIQLAGFTLATKQPSTTAAFLAKTLTTSTRESGLAILYILRAQVVAVVGNLCAVIPVCFLISFAFLLLGYPIMSKSEAHEVFESSHLLGPTVIFASFTGALLFLSSLVAGWFENFCIITNLPERIEYSSKIIKFIGLQNTKSISNFLKSNSNALAANISLGLFLGLAPQLMKFMGLPLEVRHITLASGTFASALPLVYTDSYSIFSLVDSIGGLVLVGICNIFVSFALSLTLALSASGASKVSFAKLLKWTTKTIWRRPYVLIFPERRKGVSK